MRVHRLPLALLGLTLFLTAIPAPAQAPPREPAPGRDDPELREALFRYFETRLRVDVGLTDEQVAEVVPRVRAMERERARSLRERRAASMALRRAYREGADDAELESLLNRVEEIERRMRAEIDRLMGEIDTSLTVRQRVEFRAFLHRFRQDVRDRVQKLRGGRPSPGARRAPPERPEQAPSSPDPP
jgi:hypothetical protein